MAGGWVGGCEDGKGARGCVCVCVCVGVFVSVCVSPLFLCLPSPFYHSWCVSFLAPTAGETRDVHHKFLTLARFPFLCQYRFMLEAFSVFFALLARLGGLAHHFFANLSQDGAKMAQHSAKMSQHSAKMAQHSAKIAQHSLQEQPQDPKKPSKVMYCRRFFGFREF